MKRLPFLSDGHLLMRQAVLGWLALFAGSILFAFLATFVSTLIQDSTLAISISFCAVAGLLLALHILLFRNNYLLRARSLGTRRVSLTSQQGRSAGLPHTAARFGTREYAPGSMRGFVHSVSLVIERFGVGLEGVVGLATKLAIALATAGILKILAESIDPAEIASVLRNAASEIDHILATGVMPAIGQNSEIFAILATFFTAGIALAVLRLFRLRDLRFRRISRYNTLTEFGLREAIYLVHEVAYYSRLGIYPKTYPSKLRQLHRLLNVLLKDPATVLDHNDSDKLRGILHQLEQNPTMIRGMNLWRVEVILREIQRKRRKPLGDRFKDDISGHMRPPD